MKSPREGRCARCGIVYLRSRLNLVTNPGHMRRHAVCADCTGESRSDLERRRYEGTGHGQPLEQRVSEFREATRGSR